MSSSLSKNPGSSSGAEPPDASGRVSSPPRTLYELILDRYDLDGVRVEQRLLPLRGDSPPEASDPVRTRPPPDEPRLGGRLAESAEELVAEGRERQWWRGAPRREQPWRLDAGEPRPVAPPLRRARRAREEWSERGF